MTYHTVPHRSSSFTVAQNDGTGWARLPGPPAHHHTAARAARPSISSPPGSHRTFQPRRPHHQPTGPRKPARPRAGTGASQQLPPGPTRPRPLPAGNNPGAFQVRLQPPGVHLPPAVPPNRLRPGTAGAPLGPKRAPQVKPVSSTALQEAPPDGPPASHSSSLLGCLCISPGNGGRRRASQRGRPSSGTQPPQRAPHHSARPCHHPAQPRRPRPTRFRLSSSGGRFRKSARGSKVPQCCSGPDPVARGSSLFLCPFKWRRISRAQRRALSARVRHDQRLLHAPRLLP
ncbi:hypothetical protein NDU88_001777 [Pleurodeles waltl]|uniref:Basic proline-rich protein-like n=1 Tax=Pleurodeles waltl TaxID=8319 RepID=A0AAV7SBU4_PLEWA|nr:hypothetical protein NDU88_001777 [Pleurodeles waltl]